VKIRLYLRPEDDNIVASAERDEDLSSSFSIPGKLKLELLSHRR
jgi:hypothetical protein